MARRSSKTPWANSLVRTFKALTRISTRSSAKVIKDALQGAAPVKAKRPQAKKSTLNSGDFITGVAMSAAGPRRYQLYKPPSIARDEHLPLLIMLHGCGQDAQELARSSRMNQIAARERFFVLYPEQDRLANLQGCWNWFETRNGRAQAEENSIIAAIESVCLSQAIDRNKIAIAGISAGASMAMLLATNQPQYFCAVAMHSGIAPGVAYSSASAIQAMFGHAAPAAPLPPVAINTQLPALLVIHGLADHTVVPSNGQTAAIRWAERVAAKASAPRTVQRGARYAAIVTDYRKNGRLIATLCLVNGLGHAWSGGAASQSFSDPKGPDASRMIWAFCAQQFKSTVTG